MSIDIDWESLTTGPSGAALADSIRDFVHSKFQQMELPRFIRSVHVHSFTFGDECPTVELKDISDPLPDFYGDEDEDSSEEDVGEEADGEDGREQEDVKRSMRPPNLLPQTINPHHSPSTNKKPFPEALNTPFLPRSTTPGIPGGTSNLSYFHLPLSAGLSYAATPLGSAGVTPFSPPPQWSEHFGHPQRPSSPLRAHPPQRTIPTPTYTPYADPTSRPSTAYSHPSSPPFVPDAFNAAAAATPSAPADITGEEEDRSQDLQTTLHISYNGSMSLSLTAEILLDYPMPSFVGIPLKLQITGMTFDGVALLAYLRGASSPSASVASASVPLQQQPGMPGSISTGAEEPKQNQIKFCFLGPEDARAVLGSAEGQGISNKVEDIDGNGERERDGDRAGGSSDGGARGGLLREIRVESEVGRQENGKQVLKNVGKIEKFVVEQMRKIFEEEFVWPSFWSFLV